MKTAENLKGTLALLGLLAAGLGTLQAGQLQVNGSAPYMCATVQNASTANGTPIVVYSCSPGPDKQWTYSEGQFLGIGTANGTSMCLDVKDNGTTPGTTVDLWPCNGQQNQQWQLGNGGIVGKQSGLCLDSAGGPTVDNAIQLVMNLCNGTTSQNWVLNEMIMELDTNAPYKCADAEGGSGAAGTPVISYSCSGEPGYVWTYQQNEILGFGTGAGARCFSATGSTAGSLVVLNPCTGKENQEWTIETGEDIGISGSTINQIVSLRSGLCLDSSGGPSVGGGTQLVVNKCTAATSQNWLVY